MKIRNFKELSTNELRQKGLQIVEAGLSAIDTRKVIKEAVSLEGHKLCVKDQICSLASTKRIFVLAVGKCAATAAHELETILGDQVHGGIVIDVAHPRECQFKKIECFIGTHPMPSEQNIEIAKKIHRLLSQVNEDDLVLCVVSGGGSTLLCLPEEGMTCIDEGLILSELFRQGATIQEINTVRKHTSLLRGGQLAKLSFPAQVMALIFSDVPGDDIRFVASGPTVQDHTTVEDADKVLAKYGVLQACNMEHCGLIETPKEDKYFKNVYNILVVSNSTALQAMADQASELGLESDICDNCMTGEAREVARQIADRLHKSPAKSALLYGGETTVHVVGHGEGGRNQELGLAALQFIKDDELIIPFASDGRDHGKYAGVIVDKETKQKAEKLKLRIKEYLDENNETPFFAATHDLILTGDTGSNVSDLIVALKS